MTLIRRRLASVDAFRALTMLLMIFVNDLVSIVDAPRWMLHAEEGVDGMGLADVVFPAFLFIVGLSVPFAIDGRLARGESKGRVFWHILVRSFALLCMGFFVVNYEEYNRAFGYMPRYWWLLWISMAFFLVWLDYPKAMAGWLVWLLRGVGIGLLGLAVLTYHGGSAGHEIGMRAHWYGILGLIGWCYLICSSLYLWIGDRPQALTIIMGVFLAICVIDKAHGLNWMRPMRQFVWIVGSGSLPMVTMAGVVAALVYRSGVGKGRAMRSLGLLLGLAVVMTIAGLLFRPYWGISKIASTPSWVLICAAISLVVFALLAYISDIRGWDGWYNIIKPAGTSTLTCYLLTYLHFAIAHLLGDRWRLPAVLRTGNVGVLKCVIYSFLIVWITGFLEKRKFRLSI